MIIIENTLHIVLVGDPSEAVGPFNSHESAQTFADKYADAIIIPLMSEDVFNSEEELDSSVGHPYGNPQYHDMWRNDIEDDFRASDPEGDSYVNFIEGKEYPSDG